MLCQNLLPTRGPAMTVLPARVVIEHGSARQRPMLAITNQQRLRLAKLAERLADRGLRDSVATALLCYPLLEGVADAVRRWPPRDLEQVTGQAAVRQWLADINDLLRLALVVLPGDDVVAEVQAMGALSVYAPVPWLGANASSAMRLVLFDTPGPDEELRPGVLNGLVEDQVRHAHELLVVVDATRRASQAEESVRKLTDSALPWPGWARLFVAVNRADMVPELEDLLGTGKMIGDDALPPELRAIWDRLADGAAGMSARVVVTAARHGQAAAGVLQPAERQEAADQAFRRLIRRAGRADASASPEWLRAEAQEVWQWSGVPNLIDSFLEPRAREPDGTGCALCCPRWSVRCRRTLTGSCEKGFVTSRGRPAWTGREGPTCPCLLDSYGS